MGREVDVLVAGSGAAGFAAAITAAAEGLDVLMVEKAPVFGGTTAYSAGVVWVPGSRHAREAGIEDSGEAALRYLQAECGNRLDPARAAAYLQHGPQVLDWLEANTEVAFVLSPYWPDYHPDLPGGSAGGRSLGPRVYDGRRLGKRFRQLRPPLESMTLLGGMMVARDELGHFYGMTRSLASAMKVGGQFLRYFRDRLGHPRGTRLANGNALVAMLAKSAFDRGIELELEAPVMELCFDDGRVSGAMIGGREGPRQVRARRGVVLACGGFPANAELRRRYYGHVAAGAAHHSAAPAAKTGDALALATPLGAAMVEDQAHAAAWVPVSLLPVKGGGLVPYPHFLDRGKAGFIAVDRRGRRFISEALSYHDFVPALAEACAGDGEIRCHLICDADALRAYGLGRAPPFPGSPGPYLRSGYLLRADSLEGLAAACAIDPAGLVDTVRGFNEGAVQGIDPQFGKGGDAYQRFNGSPGHRPNPCVGPVAKPPFYAVRLVPGDIGTFIGLRADAHSRVLDAGGRPILGLYAAGNDAASFMGGTYPGAGITIGPALVFGHLAGRALLAEPGEA